MSSNAWKVISDNVKYFGHDFWEEYGDPQVSKLPTMYSGPWQVLAVTLVYLYIIKIAGPEYMKNRKPFNLKYIMVVHNLLLTGLNGFGFFYALFQTDIVVSVFQCRPLRAELLNDSRLLIMGYGFYLTKYIDFFDTLYFVLRKKYTHITRLHLIHHATMPFWCFVGLKFGFYTCNGMIPMANSLVHMFMYTYYGLSALGYKKHIILKKHITQLQLLQFVVVFFHSLYFLLSPSCSMYKLINVFQVTHGILFYCMFYSFYKHAYLRTKKE